MAQVGSDSAFGDRPFQLRAFVAISLILSAVNAVLDPREAFGFPYVVLTILSLFLLKKLWDASSAAWWLFTLVTGLGAVVAFGNVAEHALAWGNVALYGLLFVLLVAPETRTWFNVRATVPWLRAG